MLRLFFRGATLKYFICFLLISNEFCDLPLPTLEYCFCFLLISNKFCDLTLLPWKGGRCGESSAVRKLYRTGGVGGGGCVRKHYRFVPPGPDPGQT
jgi:hypothetical protein